MLGDKSPTPGLTRSALLPSLASCYGILPFAQRDELTSACDLALTVPSA